MATVKRSKTTEKPYSKSRDKNIQPTDLSPELSPHGIDMRSVPAPRPMEIAPVQKELIGSEAPAAEPIEIWRTSVLPSDGLDTPMCCVTGIRFAQGWEMSEVGAAQQSSITACYVEAVKDGVETWARLRDYFHNPLTLTDHEFVSVSENLLLLLWNSNHRSDRRTLPSKCLDSIYGEIASAVAEERQLWPTFSEWTYTSRIAAYLGKTPLLLWFLFDCYRVQTELRSRILDEIRTIDFSDADTWYKLKWMRIFWEWANTEGDAEAERAMMDMLLDVGMRLHHWPYFEPQQQIPSELFAKQLPRDAKVKFWRYEHRELWEPSLGSRRGD